MIDADFIDFLISKQGQKIAVRTDPNSPVWNETPMDMPDPEFKVSEEKWISATSMWPAGETDHYHVTLIQFPEQVYMLTSVVMKTYEPDGEFGDLVFNGNYKPNWFDDLEYSYQEPTKVIQRSFYSWDMAMAGMLASSGFLSWEIEHGNARLFKFSKATNSWREQVSASTIAKFEKLCNQAYLDDLENTASIQFTFMPELHYGSVMYDAGLYLHHIPAMMKPKNHQDMELAWVTPQLIAELVLIRTKKGELYPMKLIPFLAKNFGYSKALFPQKEDKYVKFLKDKWHIYEVPDCDIRADDADLIEQFDEFLLTLFQAV